MYTQLSRPFLPHAEAGWLVRLRFVVVNPKTLFLSIQQRTPLDVAVECGNRDTMEYLVFNGAVVNICDWVGVSELRVLLIPDYYYFYC